MKIVGECGNCGDDVIVPLVWHGIYPPKPTCKGCGKTVKEDRRVLDMK